MISFLGISLMGLGVKVGVVVVEMGIIVVEYLDGGVGK